MGFGFNLFVIFILLPLTVVLFIVWLITGKKFFGMTIGLLWMGIIGLVLLVSTLHLLTDKKELDRDDVYGSYIIDRTKFPGKQADWQYEHFRFEITKQNEMLFHVTNKKRIIKTYRGKIAFHDAYKSPRMMLYMDTPNHHILQSNPTLYRTVWSFYYVFYSPEFGNVFFTKGQWEPIAE